MVPETHMWRCLAECGCDRLWETLAAGWGPLAGLCPGRRSTIGGFTVSPSEGGNAPHLASPRGEPCVKSELKTDQPGLDRLEGGSQAPHPLLTALGRGWGARGPIIADCPAPLIV